MNNGRGCRSYSSRYIFEVEEENKEKMKRIYIGSSMKY